MNLEFRPHAWLDTETMTEMYGIQARKDKGKWMHTMEKGAPLLFDNQADRDTRLDALRKRGK
jgi:hypothetical protein